MNGLIQLLKTHRRLLLIFSVTLLLFSLIAREAVLSYHRAYANEVVIQSHEPVTPEHAADEPVVIVIMEKEGVQYRHTYVIKDGRQGQVFVGPDADGNTREMTPEEFARIAKPAKDPVSVVDYIFLFFNITGWFSFFWVTIGFAGQIMFTGRMLVQWLISEKKGKSVVPPLFWWMSLGGASMLIIYFIWRKDVVGVVGQSTGWFIYIRNLWMINSSKRDKPVMTDDPGPEPELSDD